MLSLNSGVVKKWEKSCVLYMHTEILKDLQELRYQETPKDLEFC